MPRLQRASMRPRSNDRGNAAIRPYQLASILASMKPRSNDRGNDWDLVILDESHYLLQ